MLQLTNLTKTYPTPQGPLHVLDGVDLRLAAGESLALMGESGSGKSTLLHLAAGLDTPDRGDVVFEGQSVSALSEPRRAALRRQRLGLVFQQFHLVPSLSVADNLTLQARLAGRADTRWTQHLLARLGLAGLNDRYPEQLSGGQQQRLAIGRALAAKPRLLLADEPTGNLDEAAADQVLELLRELIEESGCALLMVTHSARVAAPLDRCVHLQRGRLAEAGP
ncbi:ABC transporter ATP-binding protein [Halomonas sp. McH1-25]|uniref:ABC transporter ATP-binding protein n=1 Tax=unclassified Halomonas TaxID=2609666 RepID=UPI001EF4D430|nr:MULTISPECIES: ABC transporter ATP-binding protein [unclassified Halomonas]MCG7599953.1 ABC transporter ATP-binding protein [Halomonas sp. McH1-25]MCP1342644.1 ABC transporter ATP-binding protein [Halomonas sp. FL8]MCP1363352.1 ABC transporter ATP-binding protein [Halomonas sp. BBD45]MCP1366494.1 ABC transporter ATP-binding protein [Halomonas sp. BBD48]